ncbi:MAG: sulfurtransferase [Piscinibacter sp.]|uniref:sulfurtransferase n=1 Tax=Piscinibacter sp. TaxID=1903157 RepID=UPI002590AAB7|nr:sulfurtransferase [Piscinibacter sp.]MCW5662989.1 sulfurtransferase [Piscinibacter sp.]
MDRVLNLSAYRFVALADLPGWRERVLVHAAGLKGTLLLAEEGINLFLAGPPDTLRGFVAWLRAQPPFAGLETKESWSDELPFRRLKVKVKREIIRMNHPTIRPQQRRAPVLDAQTLARWLDTGRDDAGREVVTLDTRNAFEVDAGRFRGALDWRLQRFSDFPAAVRAQAAALAGKTVVSYCTGGIRCEKAALVLQEAGVESVFQLDGGILKYFEQTGGQHFEGRCFVFDERQLLDAALQPAGPA